MLKDMLDDLEIAQQKKEDLQTELLNLFVKHEITISTVIVTKSMFIDNMIGVIDNNEVVDKLSEYKRYSNIVRKRSTDIIPFVSNLLSEYFLRVFNINLGPDYQGQELTYEYCLKRRSLRVRFGTYMIKYIPRAYLESPDTFDFKNAVRDTTMSNDIGWPPTTVHYPADNITYTTTGSPGFTYYPILERHGGAR